MRILRWKFWVTNVGGYGKRHVLQRPLTYVHGSFSRDISLIFYLQTNLAMSERVLCAALAPSRKTLAVLVKEACKTWKDHLWARVATLLEENVSEGLTRQGPNFWDIGKNESGENDLQGTADFGASAVEEMREVLSKMADINVEEG